jgi:hypothetical protein
MRYVNLLPALLLLVVATGCGNSSSEDKTTPASNSTTAPATITPNSNTATTQPVQQQAPVNIQAPVVNTTSQPVTQTVSKAGLNPEHGQPGHRCDISVGAPLDSKPTLPAANTTQPVVTQKSAPVISPNIPATVAPGMNPAHGQPGHRCDISVGAPLNSKPAQ